MDPLPSEAEDSAENPSEWKYDLVMDILLAFGVALNVYLIVDATTNGRLSRGITSFIRVHTGMLLHRDAVIEEAHEALYTEGTTE